MPNDLLRLPELVGEHSRQLSCSQHDAAYDLLELFTAAKDFYYVSCGWRVPDWVCWLGGIASSKPRARHWIDHSMLSEFFQGWSVNRSEPTFRCSIDDEFQNVPALAVYFSRQGLAEWLAGAGLECPAFVGVRKSKATSAPTAELQAFKTKELDKIQAFTHGLAEIIVAVDKAHRGLLPDAESAAVKKAVSRLDLRRKPSNVGNALKEIAMLIDAEGFPTSLNTIGKYMFGKELDQE